MHKDKRILKLIFVHYIYIHLKMNIYSFENEYQLYTIFFVKMHKSYFKLLKYTISNL
jgi:hypothetical protein